MAAPSTGPALQPRPHTRTEHCATAECHAGIIARKVMHGPTAQKKCDLCHELTDPREHRFRLTAAPAELCLTCHQMKHRTTVHAPVKQGQCTGCHDPHGSPQRLLLLRDPARDLCQTCHKDAYSKKKYVHGPVAVGACVLCHESHSSWQPKLLVASPEKLCAQCHGEALAAEARNRHLHAPFKSAECSTCHDAHASDHKYQLRQASPALCYSCHTELSKAIAAAPVVHEALNQSGGCSHCHSSHSSSLPKLQKASQPGTCLGCHNASLTTTRPSAQPLIDMATLLKDNPQQHGPIREGACSACHQPHAGKNFRLLGAEYPPQFYAPFTADRYALCFGCHIPDLVLKPQGAGLTRFRDGERNLHYLHVNQEKGRTCRACHEVHASRRPFHIRDAVPFGPRGWLLEINFVQTDAGGRCAPGCHNPKTYNHGGAPRMPLPATLPGGRP